MRYLIQRLDDRRYEQPSARRAVVGRVWRTIGKAARLSVAEKIQQRAMADKPSGFIRIRPVASAAVR